MDSTEIDFNEVKDCLSLADRRALMAEYNKKFPKDDRIDMVRVSLILRGRIKNPLFVTMAVKLAIQRKEELIETNRQFNSLVVQEHHAKARRRKSA